MVNTSIQIETIDLILFLRMTSCLLIKFFMKRKFHCFHLRIRRKLVKGSDRIHFLFSLSCVSCIVVIYELKKVFSTDKFKSDLQIVKLFFGKTVIT